MNKVALTIFLASLVAAPAAQAAEEEDHSAHHPGAEPSQAAPAQDDKAAAMKMEKMQEKMKKMQDLMAKMRATTDPNERARLMKEHMTSMQENMKTMGDMMGKGGMMGKKKPAGETSSAQGEKPGGEMMMGGMMMHKKMEDRMDAMQKMLEQLIEREAMEQQMEGR